MMSLKTNIRPYALLLMALISVSALSGCGESAPPETDSQPEEQEPMNTGPMSLDSDPASNASGGVTE